MDGDDKMKSAQQKMIKHGQQLNESLAISKKSPKKKISMQHTVN